jgi:DNA end-binding protein Ku
VQPEITDIEGLGQKPVLNPIEDQYETALIDLINQKRAGKTIRPKERPKGENVVDLMEALRRSVGGGAAPEPKAAKKGGKKPRKAAAC